MLSAVDMDGDTKEQDSNLKKVKFSYWDSGTEWDAANNFESGGTLGLKLIKLLAQQIGATLDISTENGTKFVFIFNVHI